MRKDNPKIMAAVEKLMVLGLNVRRETKQDDEQNLMFHFHDYSLFKRFSSVPKLRLFRGGQNRNRKLPRPDKEFGCG